MAIEGPDLLARIREDYELGGECELEPAGPGHNRNFRLSSGARTYHVRVYVDGRYKDDQPIRDEIDLLRGLRAAGVAVCAPIERRDGDYLSTLDRTAARWYALFEFADGAPVVRGQEWSDDVAGRFGTLVARMHVASDRVVLRGAREALDVETLIGAPVRLLLRGGPEPSLAERLSTVLSELESQLTDVPRQVPLWGPIHADLHGQNLHIDAEGQVRLFDFDSCAVGWRAHDLALCWLTLQPAGWPAFLDAYRQIRRVDALELSAVPWLGKARMIRDCSLTMRWGSTQPSGVWSYEMLTGILERVDALVPVT